MSYNNFSTFENLIIYMEHAHPQDFYNLDWQTISNYRFLSEAFMDRYFLRFLDKKSICSHQKLSEAFIIKYIDYVNFKIISNTQVNNLSNEFIFNHCDKLDMKIIAKHKKVAGKTTTNNGFSYNIWSKIIQSKKELYNNVFIQNKKHLYGCSDELLLNHLKTPILFTTLKSFEI